MALLDQVVTNLQGADFFRIALPFLFTFAIVYGLLSRVALFGERSGDKVNAIVAMAAAFFVSRFVVTAGLEVPVVVSNYFGALTVVFLFLMAAMMVRGLVRRESAEEQGGFGTVLLVLAVLAVVSLFVAWGGLGFVLPQGVNLPTAFLTTTNFITLVVVLAALLLIGFVTGIISFGGLLSSGGSGGGGGGYGDMSTDELAEAIQGGDQDAIEEAQRRGLTAQDLGMQP